MTLAWLLEDELAATNPAALSVLHATETELIMVPSIWALEVANALRLSERRGRATRAETTQFVNGLSVLTISVDDTAPERAFAEILTLARDLELTVYDAAYLELAIRERLPLATLDRALQNAAREAGVELLG
jgi:predicted nucleic acid-binding protein